MKVKAEFVINPITVAELIKRLKLIAKDDSTLFSRMFFVAKGKVYRCEIEQVGEVK